MAVEIAQATKRTGKARWEWSIWLEGPDSELDKIQTVEYLLHPTFPSRLRQVKNRRTKFRLKSSGWGEFMVHATCTWRSGRTTNLRHWLRLEPNSSAAASAEKVQVKQQPTVLLSFSVANGDFAEALAKALKESNIEVLTSADLLQEDAPWEISFRVLVRRADAMVVVFSDDPNAWARREIQVAEEHMLPIIPVLLGSRVTLPEDFDKRRVIEARGRSDANRVCRDLTKAIHDLLDPHR